MSRETQRVKKPPARAAVVRPNWYEDFMVEHPVLGPLLSYGPIIVIFYAVGLVTGFSTVIAPMALGAIFTSWALVQWRKPDGAHRKRYVETYGMPKTLEREVWRRSGAIADGGEC